MQIISARLTPLLDVESRMVQLHTLGFSPKRSNTVLEMLSLSVRHVRLHTLPANRQQHSFACFTRFETFMLYVLQTPRCGDSGESSRLLLADCLGEGLETGLVGGGLGREVKGCHFRDWSRCGGGERACGWKLVVHEVGLAVHD